MAGAMGTLIGLGVTRPIPEARVRTLPKLMDCQWGWEELSREKLKYAYQKKRKIDGEKSRTSKFPLEGFPITV